jgi:hypothetical protein
VNAPFHMEVTGAEGSISSMAAHTRSRADDDRRVKAFTRWTLAGALAATASFGGLAAAYTHHAQAATQSDDSSSSEDMSSGSSTLTPSTSAPQQSFSPPVARSGGS